MVVLGSQLAHALAYRLAYPSVPIRVQVLAATGHGYLSALPLALGVVGAVALCTLGWTAVDAAHGRASQSIPPAAFALLPLLGFTAQEFVERWLAVGGLPWWMVEQPTFRIGLLLQLPFAAVAFAVTRLLLGGAQQLGRRLARRQPSSVAPTSIVMVALHGLVTSARFLPARPTRGPPLSVSC
jgi:hypothetical protein